MLTSCIQASCETTICDVNVLQSSWAFLLPVLFLLLLNCKAWLILNSANWVLQTWDLNIKYILQTPNQWRSSCGPCPELSHCSEDMDTWHGFMANRHPRVCLLELSTRVWTCYMRALMHDHMYPYPKSFQERCYRSVHSNLRWASDFLEGKRRLPFSLSEVSSGKQLLLCILTGPAPHHNYCMSFAPSGST